MFEKNLFFIKLCNHLITDKEYQLSLIILKNITIIILFFFGNINHCQIAHVKSYSPLLENIDCTIYFYSKNTTVFGRCEQDATRVHHWCAISTVLHIRNVTRRLFADDARYTRSMYYANMRELYRTALRRVIPRSFTLSRV